MKLIVEHLSQGYGEKNILENLSFQVAKGEFVTILGASGSGKSTLLNLLTGITQKTSGKILVDGEEINGLTQKFSYMPQKDVLLEWETVLQNVCLYPRIHKKKIDDASIKDKLEIFGLQGYEKAYPSQLSGGMRQRVAFLRTVLCQGDILLLDEPFGALDIITRTEMQDWLHDLRNQLNQTIILVTHDIEEAIYLSDRILILGGKPASIGKEFNLTDKIQSRESLFQSGEIRNEIYQYLKGEFYAK